MFHRIKILNTSFLTNTEKGRYIYASNRGGPLEGHFGLAVLFALFRFLANGGFESIKEDILGRPCIKYQTPSSKVYTKKETKN